LLEDNDSPFNRSAGGDDYEARQPVTINLKRVGLGDDFTLWMGVGDETSDTLRGIVFDRHGEQTNVHFLGAKEALEPGECGWDPALNGNTVLNTTLADGTERSFDLTDIDDVRELEKMGYNFWMMKFDTPGQIPIPDLGPDLSRADPNPFEAQTVIEYMVPKAYEVSLRILDGSGRRVRELVDCIALAGIYQTTWDGTDILGNRVAAGVYKCRFTAGDYVETIEIEVDR
jgi:hypothetical protein